MMDPQHISQDDLALYALQTLSENESAAVREHLSKCDLCRTEVARFRGDLGMVGLSVDQHRVPEGARERFTRKLAAEAGANVPDSKSVEPVSIDQSSKFRAARWTGWVAAAAASIACAGLGLQVTLLRAHLHDTESRIAALESSKSRAEQVAELLTAPTAQRVLLTTPKAVPAPTGRVVYLASRGQLILQASNLAPAPAKKTYELWLIPMDGSAPVSAGLFRPDAAGNGSVVLPAIPEGVRAKAFGVTLEDEAGSKTPTAPILLAGAVPQSGS